MSRRNRPTPLRAKVAVLPVPAIAPWMVFMLGIALAWTFVGH